jgi:hypothetical protein
MSTEPVRRTNLAAIECEGVHSYRKVSVGLAAALGRRSEPTTLD